VRPAPYNTVKDNLLLTTAGLCGSGTIAAFFVGGTSLGASFAFGSAGALFYVKLLASKAEGGGAPSILVPVVLFMALNRWQGRRRPHALLPALRLYIHHLFRDELRVVSSFQSQKAA